MTDEPFVHAWAVLKGMTGDQDPRVQAHRGNIPYAPEFDSPFRRQRPIRGEQPRGRNAPVREIQDVYGTGGADARRIRAQNRAGEPVYQPQNPPMHPNELEYYRTKHLNRFKLPEEPMEVMAQPHPEEEVV